jgi:hypothetical protein
VAVGETQNQPFQLSFNSSLKVDLHHRQTGAELTLERLSG